MKKRCMSIPFLLFFLCIVLVIAVGLIRPASTSILKHRGKKENNLSNSGIWEIWNLLGYCLLCYFIKVLWMWIVSREIITKKWRCISLLYWLLFKFLISFSFKFFRVLQSLLCHQTLVGLISQRCWAFIEW